MPSDSLISQADNDAWSQFPRLSSAGDQQQTESNATFHGFLLISAPSGARGAPNAHHISLPVGRFSMEGGATYLASTWQPLPI